MGTRSARNTLLGFEHAPQAQAEPGEVRRQQGRVVHAGSTVCPLPHRTLLTRPARGSQLICDLCGWVKRQTAEDAQSAGFWGVRHGAVGRRP
jgi:glutathionyl-hydroquinone reductase